MTIPDNYMVRPIMSYECREWFLKNIMQKEYHQ